MGRSDSGRTRKCRLYVCLSPGPEVRPRELAGKARVHEVVETGGAESTVSGVGARRLLEHLEDELTATAFRRLREGVAVVGVLADQDERVEEPLVELPNSKRVDGEGVLVLVWHARVEWLERHLRSAWHGSRAVVERDAGRRRVWEGWTRP